MTRLKTLKPRLATLQTTRLQPHRPASPSSDGAYRMRGRKLQERRLRIWSKNPHCAICKKLVAYPGGFDLDHVIPLSKGGLDDEINCQILCNGTDGCHIYKTASDVGYEVNASRHPRWLGKAQCHLTIIFGPPGAGKSSYVKQQAGSFDLVIDFDEIVSRISGEPIYQSSDRWIGPALHVRNKMLGALAKETRKTWFIATGMSESDRLWWVEKLAPSEVIILKTPLDECITRIKNDNRRPQHKKEKNIDAVKLWWSEQIKLDSQQA